jgi:hypothetical protein
MYPVLQVQQKQYGDRVLISLDRFSATWGEIVRLRPEKWTAIMYLSKRIG